MSDALLWRRRWHETFDRPAGPHATFLLRANGFLNEITEAAGHPTDTVSYSLYKRFYPVPLAMTVLYKAMCDV